MARIPVTEAFYVEDYERREGIEADGVGPDPDVADVVVLFRDLSAAKSWARSMAENAPLPPSGPTAFVWKADVAGLGAEYVDDLDGEGPDTELNGPQRIPADCLALVWSV